MLLVASDIIRDVKAAPVTIDFARHLGAVSRSVQKLERDGKSAGAVTLSRLFATATADLRDGLSIPDRIPRWFVPVSGTLERGGRFQITGDEPKLF